MIINPFATCRPNHHVKPRSFICKHRRTRRGLSDDPGVLWWIPMEPEGLRDSDAAWWFPCLFHEILIVSTLLLVWCIYGSVLSVVLTYISPTSIYISRSVSWLSHVKKPPRGYTHSNEFAVVQIKKKSIFSCHPATPRSAKKDAKNARLSTHAPGTDSAETINYQVRSISTPKQSVVFIIIFLWKHSIVSIFHDMSLFAIFRLYVLIINEIVN